MEFGAIGAKSASLRVSIQMLSELKQNAGKRLKQSKCECPLWFSLCEGYIRPRHVIGGWYVPAGSRCKHWLRENFEKILSRTAVRMAGEHYGLLIYLDGFITANDSLLSLYFTHCESITNSPRHVSGMKPVFP